MYQVGIIGCGRVARHHAGGYLGNQSIAQMVGACDPDEDARNRFAEEFGIENVFASAEAMLGQLHLDVVSICTPNPTHAELTVLAAKKGVRGIVCEKPMAMNLPQADSMLRVCEANDVRLIVSHQRRFEQTFMIAKELLDSGAIGQLLRMEAHIGGWDLMSWGTHWLDIFRFYNNDEPTDWVFGQTEIHDPKHFFGHHVERAGFAKIKYANGVEAVYHGGDITTGMTNRLFGTEGVIEVEPLRPEGIGGPIRVLNATSDGWKIIDVPEEDHVIQPFVREMATFFECLESGEKHPLEGASAREALVQIIGIYESSRTRAVVHFPIHVTDNPFLAMLGSEI